MNDLFLSAVRFKDFRTFGDFQVDIAPGPGLTLLVGTNGLGKSNFFDALEWGLTGAVRRFKDVMGAASPGTYLTRRGVIAGRHAVSMMFNGEAEIDRGPQGVPAAADVVSLLKRPNWTAQIEDIGTYLAFTHFLGQAAQQRFTSRDRNEQWASLKGPSGIERLDEVRNGLRGRATELAFRRRIKRDTEAVAEFERQLADWAASRTRLDRLRSAADASGALVPALFEQRLVALAAAVARRAPDHVDDVGAPPEDRLVAIAESLAELRQTLAARRGLLDSIGDLSKRFAAEQGAANPNDPAILAVAAAAANANAALGVATAASTRARETLASAAAKVAAADAEVRRLDTARANREAGVRAETEVAKIAEDLRRLEEELATAQGELIEIYSEISTIDERAADLAGLIAARDEAGVAARLAEGLPPLEEKVAASEAAGRQSEAAAAQIRDDLAGFVAERDRITAELLEARAARDAARSRATAVAAAVALIAAHTHDDDTDCPVCQTPFKPGELRLLAGAAASGQDGALASASGRVTQLEADFASNAASLTAAEAAIAAAATAAATLEADRRARDDVRGRLAAGFAAPVGDLVAAVLEVRRVAAENLAAAQAAAAAGAPRKAEWEVRATALRGRIGRLQGEIAAARAQLAAQAAAARSSQERLAAAGAADTTLDDLNPALTDALAERAGLLKEQAAAEEVLRIAVEAEEQARSQSEAAETTVNRLEAARAVAQAATAALARRWQEVGLTGLPDAAVLEAAVGALTEEGRQVERLEDERAALVAAFEATVRNGDLKDLITEMERIGGAGIGDAPDAHEHELERALEAAKQALQASETAHRAVGAFADKLQDEARTFSTQFLTPLNGLIDDFNEALLSTPGETVRLNAAYHKDRTQFDMGLRYRDALDNALFNTNLPPEVVLSEGQLAANGFSILCAASTAYDWSNWRALLMDDPLQHNDIIHAAAFVDLMRNLVELRRYQLIMSTHDRAEAEFIRRKFDAAHLPCSIINLTAPSRGGVRYQAPEHNGPAQILLAEAVALSA